MSVLLPLALTCALLRASADMDPNEAWHNDDQCRGCKLFSKSFEEGVRRTARGNFGGGDVLWEEKNLGPYASSEVRLVEIQENVCRDVEDDVERGSCQAFGEDHEADVEDWWREKREAFPDAYGFLCVQKLKLCRCRSGYNEYEGSCVDVDECTLPHENNCGEDQYCSNTMGGYSCNSCDKACNTCHSSGPDGCKNCAEGYKLTRGVCLSETDESQNDLLFVAVFWVVFTGMYFLKRSYALVVAILGVGFCVYVSFPDHTFQLPINIHDEEIFE